MKYMIHIMPYKKKIFRVCYLFDLLSRYEFFSNVQRKHKVCKRYCEQGV